MSDIAAEIKARLALVEARIGEAEAGLGRVRKWLAGHVAFMTAGALVLGFVIGLVS